MRVINTPRLILRSFELNDLNTLITLASNPSLTQHTENIPYPRQQMASERWLKAQLRAYKQHQALVLAIIRQQDAALIGGISLMDISQYHRRAEIGYWIGLPFWGNNFASEAVSALTNYAFTHLHLQRVEARCFSSNLQSIRVLEKSGFLFEGELKNAHYFKDRFVNIRLFAKLAN